MRSSISRRGVKKVGELSVSEGYFSLGEEG
jgi:hypothetical protein